MYLREQTCEFPTFIEPLLVSGTILRSFHGLNELIPQITHGESTIIINSLQMGKLRPNEVK